MKIGIIGIGLIGGSLGLALKRAKESVIGWDNDKDIRQNALNCVDSFADSIQELADATEIVVIATPLDAIELVLNEIKDISTVITDVTSVKRLVITTAQNVLGENFTRFVPGHPIAGREKSGFATALDNLFEGQKVVLTPTSQTEDSALQLVTDLWQRVNAQVEYMNAQEHDKIFALTSHLPHVLAYTLVHSLLQSDHKDKISDYIGGGFRDFTRIAESSPELWCDICFANRDNLLHATRIFEKELTTLINALETDDRETLYKILHYSSHYKRTL